MSTFEEFTTTQNVLCFSFFSTRRSTVELPYTRIFSFFSRETEGVYRVILRQTLCSPKLYKLSVSSALFDHHLSMTPLTCLCQERCDLPCGRPRGASSRGRRHHRGCQRRSSPAGGEFLAADCPVLLRTHRRAGDGVRGRPISMGEGRSLLAPFYDAFLWRMSLALATWLYGSSGLAMAAGSSERCLWKCIVRDWDGALLCIRQQAVKVDYVWCKKRATYATFVL